MYKSASEEESYETFFSSVMMVEIISLSVCPWYKFSGNLLKPTRVEYFNVKNAKGNIGKERVTNFVLSITDDGGDKKARVFGLGVSKMQKLTFGKNKVTKTFFFVDDGGAK
jgi:hypothetical protein